jgi:hypothetical protein
MYFGFGSFSIVSKSVLCYNLSMEWIKVTDKLPENKKTVLFSDSEEVYVGYLDTNNNWYEFIYSEDGDWIKYVTHWMPLPKPPVQLTKELK